MPSNSPRTSWGWARPRRFVLTAGLSLAILVPLGGDRAGHAEESTWMGAESYQLDNGLRVILHVDRRLPVVATNIWYYVGAKDEPPGRSGFAHLFEHLMFKGTGRVPTGQFDALMEAGGGSNNATTSFDRTNYFCTGPSSLLPTLLWLEADRMEALGPAMTQEKLDDERKVVRNERRQSYEITPYGKGELAVYEHMFPRGHPYRLGVIGSHEEIEAATVADVQSFFARFYVPNNASLVVAGDFDPAAVRPLIAGLFGSLPRGEDPPRNIVPRVELPAERRATVVDPQVELPRVSFVWHSPASYAAGDAEMDLVAGVLTQGKSSRLYKRLVYVDRLAQDVSAYQQSMALGSLFQIDVTAAPGAALDAVERAVNEELARLVESGPDAPEVLRIVNGIESSSISGLQSVAGMADRLNAYQFWFGTPAALERDLGRYRQATPGSVGAVARDVLRADRRLVLRIVPPAAGGPNAREQRPPPAAASAPSLPAPEVYRLPNGLTVWHLSRPGLPLASLRLVASSGARFDPPGKAGLAALTAGMLDEGAGRWDALAFSQALEDVGARLSAAADRHATTVSLEVLQRNLAPALELFAAAIRTPRFEAAEWQRVQALALADLEQADADPSVTARRLGLAAWFGEDHPYGWPVEGRPRTVATLSLDDVKACYAAGFTPATSTLLVTGAVTRAELEPALASTLGEWKTPGHVPRVPGAWPKPAGDVRPFRVLLLERPGASQTVVRFVLPGVPYSTPDRLALQALNTVFGGSFTSRLNNNLRERNGFTYGARSAFDFQREGGSFVASSSVHAQATGPALTEFLKEFKRIHDGDLSAEEAEKARATREHEWVERLSTLSGLLATYAEAATHGRGAETVASDLATLAQGVQAARLNALAGTHLSLDRGVLVLVGDRGEIVKGLNGLGLPEPETVKED